LTSTPSCYIPGPDSQQDGGEASLGPQAVAFWRYVFAAPMLLLLNFAVNRRLPQRPNKYAILAGTFFAVDIGLWHWGLTLTTVANSTFLVGLGNLLVGFTAWAILKERPTPMWAVAAAVAVAGAALLSLGGSSDETAQTNLTGDALSFAAAIFVSFYVVFAKLARRTMNALDVLFWATVTEAIVAAALIGLSNVIPPMPAEAIAPASWSALLAPFLLAIVVQTMGQGLIIFGLGSYLASRYSHSKFLGLDSFWQACSSLPDLARRNGRRHRQVKKDISCVIYRLQSLSLF